MNRIFTLFWAISILTLLTACSVEPQPIPYGNANCAHCNMTISDTRYGAELVNDKGKPSFFDAVECLAAYLNANPEAAQKASFLMVTDFTNPPTLLRADSAHFVRSEAIPSPMGMNLLAVSTRQAAEKIQQEQGADLLSWAQVLELMQKNEKHH